MKIWKSPFSCVYLQMQAIDLDAPMQAIDLDAICNASWLSFDSSASCRLRVPSIS
jgi:hypothetical protein